MIQWYPGHMRKAVRVMEESIAAHDVVIEVLDARMPRASENPVVRDLRKHRPCVKVLSKSDLADPVVTAQWIRWFEAHRSERSKEHPNGNVAAIAITTESRQEIRRKIPELCRRLVPHRTQANRTVRAMVLGIPNVGKSTLINVLAGRRAANVGDKPAITKSQQHVEVADDFTLSDTPGILWPNINDERAGYRLAFAGAIPDTAIESEPVALFGAKFLLERYPSNAVARYKLDAVPESADALLDEIGRRRGALRAGGVIDRNKAADILLHDFRAGALGRISLETPPAERR
jgi:ribosome biogenesis GTPase A